MSLRELEHFLIFSKLKEARDAAQFSGTSENAFLED
jgi:hypothetical protein